MPIISVTGGPVQFFDDNGDPLSGGKVHTHEPGTTTDKASYPTRGDAAAGTNANANPVILSASGRADIWVLGPTDLDIDTSADADVETWPYYGGDKPIVYQTGAITIASGAAGSEAHGIVNQAGAAVAPDNVIAIAFCTTTEWGYAVGDSIFISPDSFDQYGVEVWGNTTNVGYQFANRTSTSNTYIYKRTATAGDNEPLDPAKWEVYLRAIKY